MRLLRYRSGIEKLGQVQHKINQFRVDTIKTTTNHYLQTTIDF